MRRRQKLLILLMLLRVRGLDMLRFGCIVTLLKIDAFGYMLLTDRGNNNNPTPAHCYITVYGQPQHFAKSIQCELRPTNDKCTA